ncbi:ribonuclease H-like domain-containing protein [Tanacetum coccineum]|uniref:Ribonuclease H-like domain-containing protein n=1 Tax=Tanacetum coccineum TaxID=301880 RepID=A0ABQ5EZT8_9ASTR
MRSLLITKEMRLKSLAVPSLVDSSSHMVLMADSGTNRRSSTTPQAKSWRPCFNFARGTCRIGDACRYVHDANEKLGTTPNATTKGRGVYDDTNTLLKSLLQKLDVVSLTNTSSPVQSIPSPPTVALNTGPPTIAGPPGFAAQPHCHYYEPRPFGSVVHHMQSTTQLLQPGTVGVTSLLGQPTTLLHAFSADTLHEPSSSAWSIDLGATTHLNSSINSLSEVFPNCMYSSVSVGDGHNIPVTNAGHSVLPTNYGSLRLNNVLITPHIVKNLISVRQFVRDNNCTIEFDAFGFSVKDYTTRKVLLRCDSTGDLYPVTFPSPLPLELLVSQRTWHQRLGHPGSKVLRRMVSSNFISCNKEKPSVLCHTCQLGKHVRLPFVSSDTVVNSYFDIIHSDLWTSPILSLSGYKYYQSLYGLKQAPRAWFQRFASYITCVGFQHSHCDTSLFIYRQGMDTVYLILYVDDIVLTTSSQALLQQIISSLHTKFAMTDLGSLNYFLGISVTRDSSRMFLSQKKYAVDILERAGMVNCNPNRTPVDNESKLGVIGDVVSDPTLYRSLAGSLQFLTFTRPDISYDVQQIWMPIQMRIGLAVWILDDPPSVIVVGAEYRGVVNAVAETCWLRNLLHELHTLLSSVMLVHYDNVNDVYLSCNPVQHQRTKHIEIDIHFVRDLVSTGQVRVLHVPSRYQFADIFTKCFPSSLFKEFRSSLSVCCSPALTAVEC